MHGAQVTVVDAASFAERALGDERLVDRALGAGAGDARSVAALLADQARSPEDPCMPGSCKAQAWRLCNKTGLRWWASPPARKKGVLWLAACLTPLSSTHPRWCIPTAAGGVCGCARAEQGDRGRAARGRARGSSAPRSQPGSQHAAHRLLPREPARAAAHAPARPTPHALAALHPAVECCQGFEPLFHLTC